MTYYTYHFTWPDANEGIKNVQITGNFDDWQRTTNALVKEADKFEGDIKLNKKQDVVFKFIINDTEWKVSGDYDIQVDSSGIENNIIHADDLIAIEEFEKDEMFQSDAVNNTEIENNTEAENNTEVEIENKDNIDSRIEKSIYSNTCEQADEEDKKLTQVLTSTSSFSAVSIPDSHIDNIDNDADDDADAEDFVSTKEKYDGEDETDEQLNTPTTSVATSTVISSYNTKSKTNKFIATENIDKVDSNATLNKDDSIGIVKVPGAYPKPSETSNNPYTTSSEARSSGKRDGLISRFKSLFKY